MDWNNPVLMDPPTLPIMATIYGGPKVGKTELEASFPGLIIMAWEHPGPTLQGRKDIKMTPIVKSFEDGLAFLRWLYANPGDFKTLGIDSITMMDKVFRTEILSIPLKSGKLPKGLNDSMDGFGNGYNALSEKHAKIQSACEMIRRDRGINVIFVAHADVRKFSPPDGETYNFYGLDMHEDSAAHYINNSDLIGYLDQKTMVREGEDGKTKVASTDQLILRVKSSAAYVSGNRYGITEDLVVEKGVNPLAPYLKVERKKGE